MRPIGFSVQWLRLSLPLTVLFLVRTTSVHIAVRSCAKPGKHGVFGLVRIVWSSVASQIAV